MNKLKLVIILLMTYAINSYAQTFEVPENYKLETKEDYAKYENHVIEAVNWIIETPISENKPKRKEVNKFIMKWLTGSSDVTIYLSSDVTPFINNPDLRMVYMGGLVKYSIESKDYKNELKKVIAGINSVIIFYEINKEDIGINESVESFIALKNNGELENTMKVKLHYTE